MRFNRLLMLISTTVLSMNVLSQSIWTNPITGTNPNTSNPYTTGQSFDANISVSGIGRGSGIVGTNANDRYNANSWNTGSIDLTAYFEFTLTPNATCQIDFTSFVYTSQRSNASIANFAFRSSLDGFVADIGTPTSSGTTIDLSAGTYQNIASAITFRFYAWGASSSGNTFSINDFTFNGSTSCGGGGTTITTGVVSGGPFTVDCSGPTTDAGSVAFTSTGTFNGGNIFTAELSDASGSFASPTSIGTLSSSGSGPSGSISITIPATMSTGAGYKIRVVSDNPITTGTESSAFTITQSGSCGPVLPSTEGLIINEWSNGTAGNEEYYEFVVAGQCGTDVDIRGYILDDNNGTFTNPADYDATASGIAPGHFRFSNAAQWASIPVGSLIVIYNDAEPNPELPADDPTDANNDSLYVVSHTNALFESCTTMPTSASPDSIYTPCTYSAGGAWNPLSIRNAGDAIQVRHPDGSYYHGVSYGGTEITGGPHNLKLFTGSGSVMCGWFNDGDFFDAANWSSGAANAANQTPGDANNAINLAWLRLMRDPLGVDCPLTVLPVEIISFSGRTENGVNILSWQTESERNSSLFKIERSTDGKIWSTIGVITAAGQSQSLLKYQYIDPEYTSNINYYRLRMVDLDGTNKKYFKTVLIDNSEVSPVELIGIYNIMGQEIDAETPGIQIHVYNNGTSARIFK